LNGTPTFPDAVAVLAMLGGAAGAVPIVRNKLDLAVFVLVAVSAVAVSEIDDCNSPTTVSIGTVPEITPLLVLQDKYVGKFVAPYDVATPPAVIIG